MTFKFLKLSVLSFGIALFTSNALCSQNQNKDKSKERRPMNVDQMFERMDVNKDGNLSLEEVKGPLKNDFAKVDTNEDGLISKAELEKAPKPKMNKKKSGKLEFEEMDSNADGKLTIEEVNGSLKVMFSKLDANSDGFLTKEEMAKASKPQDNPNKQKR
jgi:Ca2+-binding EF-hand superfamily protein